QTSLPSLLRMLIVKGDSLTTVDRATLLIAASESDSNLYYATRFIAPDLFIFLEIKGERMVVMSDLEMGRAGSHASVHRLLSSSEIEAQVRAQGVSPTA